MVLYSENSNYYYLNIIINFNSFKIVTISENYYFKIIVINKDAVIAINYRKHQSENFIIFDANFQKE